MDSTQWPERIGEVKAMEGSNPMIERKPRPQKQAALNCPRCNSTQTKFCYYNNYSLSQPRYFCKTCRRYWTEGGSLRNVPVGGCSRKNKRSISSSKKVSDLAPPNFSHSASQNPKIREGQDLNLAYPSTGSYSGISEFVELPYNDNKTYHPNTTTSSTSPHNNLSHMELLKNGIASRGLMSSFMSMGPLSDSNTIYSSGLPFQEFKPSLNFSTQGFDHSGYGSLQGVQETSAARLFFPFEELKPVSTTTQFPQNRGQGESTGYWNGGLGGGSW